MINARDLLPMSWIANAKNYYARVVTVVPRVGPNPETAIQYVWLINGEDESAWSGIPLTQEMLRRNRWDINQDNEWITSYRLPSNYFVTWMNHNSPYGPVGTIITGPGETVIQFVHQLQ